MRKYFVLLVLFLSSFVVFSQANETDTTFKNYNFFGVKVDFTAWGTMPVLYFNFGEYEYKRFTNSDIKFTPYAFEITGFENEPINGDKNSVYLKSYAAHNFCPILFERYFISDVKILPWPKLHSLYGRVNYAVLTRYKNQQKSTKTYVDKQTYYTPYLEMGWKMYIGGLNSAEGIYWSTLSIGYIVGSPHIHKLAKFNGNGFFVNYEFCVGYLKNYTKYVKQNNLLSF